MNSDPQSSTPIAYQPNPAYDNEISLVDIIRVLLKRKKLILGITAVVVCIGLLYAFTQKRIYQVETILLPPSIENIQSLTALDSKVNSNTAFFNFIGSINTRKFKTEFFDKFNLLEALSSESSQVLTDKQKNNYFESFSKSLSVNFDKKSESAILTLEGLDQEKIGSWLDSLVVMANKETINQLVNNLQASINSKIKNLKINISSKRSIYKKRREDELGRLEEAYQIAKKLGIHDHLFVPNVDAISAELDNISNRLSNANNLSSYMKGTKVLQAEINALKNRKSDDIHIDGLRDLQEQLTRLESIKIDKSKLQTVTVDKKAVVDIEPIRPQRKLIVILSLILGGMLGIFGAFIMDFVSKFKS